MKDNRTNSSKRQNLFSSFNVSYIQNFNSFNVSKKPLENTEEAIKNGKFTETGNIGYTRRIVIQYLMIGVNLKYHNVVIDLDLLYFLLITANVMFSFHQTIIDSRPNENFEHLFQMTNFISKHNEGRACVVEQFYRHTINLIQKIRV